MKLKYPVLLVHGMGFRDYKHIGYWGRIPKELDKLGCDIHFGGQDSNADIETNGKHIACRIEEILNETGAEKINIIAHSKGGLDSRYAISALGMADRVASLVTVSTPHNGSRTVDRLMKFPDPLIRFVGFCTDCWFRILGDKNPNTYNIFHSFTTKGAAEFNERTPDCDGVLYQSYATVMKKPSSDMLMWLTNAVISRIEGENDGLLTPDSAKWGEFKGVYKGVGKRGISHCDQIDLRRRPLSKKEGKGISDIVDLYKNIAIDLYERGL